MNRKPFFTLMVWFVVAFSIVVGCQPAPTSVTITVSAASSLNNGNRTQAIRLHLTLDLPDSLLNKLNEVLHLIYL
ncbi:hypothetical protein ACQ4M3_41195 [Leptolyngbya sp. AN03gr2]|uniref:hypothetical protein n=1 Tax=Leptolyngbya sp. AN03gr2 TaxID=3423364 RepID=UPI003D31AE04